MSSSPRFAGDLAKSYDERVRQMIPGYETIHRLVDLILSNELPKEASLLVVGAGTGQELLQLAKNHPGWRFQAIDPSENMSAIAREKLTQAGVLDRVEWHLGTMDDFAGEDAFDAATMLLALHFVPPYAKGAQLAAIADRLTPGAPLLLADSFGDPTTTRFKRLESLGKAWALAQGADPKAVEEAYDPSRKDLHRIAEDNLKALLRDAGFIDIQRIYQALFIGGWLARTSRG